MLFSDRSVWTMLHGIVLGGGALLMLGAALFVLMAFRPESGSRVPDHQSRNLAWLLVAAALVVWLTVLAGTYVVFPPYRAAPPEGLTELSGYPRSLLLASPDTAWLHAFAMESKEHMPWIAAMLATVAAFIAVRYRSNMLDDPGLRHYATVFVAVSFALVAFVSLMGVFVNKVAPLE